MDELLRVPDAFAYCESLTDKVKQDLVRHGLLCSFSMLTMLNADETAGASLDALVFAKLLEVIAASPRTLIELASGGTPSAPSDAPDLLCTRAEARGLIIHGHHGLARARQISSPETRNLVAYGLDAALQWLISTSDSKDGPEIPVDLLLYSRMLEATFEPTHAIAHMAAGKPDLPWIVLDE